MKIQTILNLVLAIALVVLCVLLAKNKRSLSVTSDGDAVMNTIMTRTSIRSYTDRAVSADTVEMLLRAGMAAPTAINAQPWHFVVVNERAKLDELAGTNRHGDMLRQAPLAIVVCGNMEKAMQGPGQAFWIQDCSAATENILLAAHALGLGAVWTGCYPMEERVAAVSEVLGLPETIVPLCVIVMGYSNENPQPKDKWKEENISYNLYGGTSTSQAAAVKTVPAEEKTFREFDVTTDFRCNPFTWFKGDGLLLCAGDKNSSNAMTIGWGALGNIWERGTSTMTVYVAEGRYTHQFMEKTKCFTVMAFDDNHKDILDYMGHNSGRDGDKAKALGLHTLYTENGTPYYAEASEVYECEVIYHAPFDPKGFGNMPKRFYKDFPPGIHSMYMGKIVKAMKK